MGPNFILRRRGLLMAGTVAGTGLLAAPAVHGQGAWPTRAVRVIVPFTPGGATDGMARVTAAKLQEKLGQTFVVENRPGANGAVGGQAVARETPDGYTFLFSASIQILAPQETGTVTPGGEPATAASAAPSGSAELAILDTPGSPGSADL